MSFQPKPLSQQQIESQVDQLLFAYKSAEGCELSFPIPIEQIAEFHLGYELVYTDEGLFSETDFLGGICFDTDVIYLNTSLENQEGRMGFTLAHEIGHHVLHRQAYLEFLKGDKPEILCREQAQKPLIEKQADQFAASLLMPAEMLKKLWHRPKVRNVYDAYREAGQFIKQHQLENVSISALVNRLNDLRLIPDIGYQSGPPRPKFSLKNVLFYKLKKLFI